MPQVAWHDAIAPPPDRLAQHTSPLGQFDGPVQVNDAPPMQLPVGAHISEAPPPPPSVTQQSSVVESHVIIPQVSVVDGPLPLPLPVPVPVPVPLPPFEPVPEPRMTPLPLPLPLPSPPPAEPEPLPVPSVSSLEMSVSVVRPPQPGANAEPRRTTETVSMQACFMTASKTLDAPMVGSGQGSLPRETRARACQYSADCAPPADSR